jgi:hypothetical protein
VEQHVLACRVGPMSINEAAAKLQFKAAIFVCSYRTAWNNFIDPEVLEAYSFDEVMNYIRKGAVK